MKLYIVMPVINCLDFTQKAIESLKASIPFKVILIDQDSNDGTQAWAESNPDIIYIRNSPKIALAAAWNQGTLRAFEDPECQYVAIVNNDVIFHQKTFDHLMAFMDKTGYLLVSADNVRDRMGVDVMKQMELPMPFTDYDCWPIEGWRAEGPDFSCYMISRDTVRVVGYFDENFHGAYCEDQDYHVRIDRARSARKKHRRRRKMIDEQCSCHRSVRLPEACAHRNHASFADSS